MHSISPILEGTSSNAKISLFDFEDDVIDDTQSLEIDSFENKLRHYKRLTMSKDDKEKCNVLDWWKQNKTSFPCLFKAAQAFLHIPAMSVPAEHIFSLAGHVVCDRRSKMLPKNVNKFIFLNKNKCHIPHETSIY